MISMQGIPVKRDMVIHMKDTILRTRLGLCWVHLERIEENIGVKVKLTKRNLMRAVNLGVNVSHFAEGFLKNIYASKPHAIGDLYDKFFYQHVFPWREKFDNTYTHGADRITFLEWVYTQRPDIDPWEYDQDSAVYKFWIEFQKHAALKFWEILEEFVFEEVEAP